MIKLENGKIVERDRKSGKIVKKASGGVIITKKALSIGNNIYPLEKIRGLTTFIKRVNEFIFEDSVVRLTTNHSSLLIYKTVKLLREGDYVLVDDR